jgi:hypothetical protein
MKKAQPRIVPPPAHPKGSVRFASIEESADWKSAASTLVAAGPAAKTGVRTDGSGIRIDESLISMSLPHADDAERIVRKMASVKPVYVRSRSFFGTSVALTENVAAVSAPLASRNDTDHRGDNFGALFFFSMQGSRWTLENKVVSSHPARQFGRSIDASGSRLIAGAPFDNYAAPVRDRDFYGIRFQKEIDPKRLLDKLFILGYLDTRKFVTSKFRKKIDADLVALFPECTTDDLRKIVSVLNASLEVKQSGSACIFEKTDTGWKETAVLSAIDGHVANQFGSHVAISGDHAVIASTSGSYFFHFRNGRWQQIEKKADPRDDETGEWAVKTNVRTPEPVAIEGEYAICGEGEMAVVYHWDGARWETQSHLTGSGSPGRNMGYFGNAVAMGTDIALVSNEYHHTGPRNDGLGLVYVYKRYGPVWELWTTLNGEGNGTPERFGHQLAISGPYILVAAPCSRETGADPAAVYLYEVKKDAIVHHGRIHRGNGISGDGFGRALAMHGKHVLVGADKFDPLDSKGDVASDGGACFLFRWQ